MPCHQCCQALVDQTYPATQKALAQHAGQQNLSSKTPCVDRAVVPENCDNDATYLVSNRVACMLLMYEGVKVPPSLQALRITQPGL